MIHRIRMYVAFEIDSVEYIESQFRVLSIDFNDLGAALDDTIAEVVSTVGRQYFVEGVVLLPREWPQIDWQSQLRLDSRHGSPCHRQRRHCISGHSLPARHTSFH